MDQSLQAQLAMVEDGISVARVSAECKRSIVWCMEKLPALYASFRQTSESRYIEEINRFVGALLTELTVGEHACPGAHKLAVKITEQMVLLHEQFGLPRLKLKPLGDPPARPRKAG